MDVLYPAHSEAARRAVISGNRASIGCRIIWASFKHGKELYPWEATLLLNRRNGK